MAPAIGITQKIPPIRYGARFTRERLILYVSVFTSFIFIALANGTPSWLLKDWFKDDVFGDEYQGAYNLCNCNRVY